MRGKHGEAGDKYGKAKNECGEAENELAMMVIIEDLR